MWPPHNPSIRLTNSIEFDVIIELAPGNADLRMKAKRCRISLQVVCMSLKSPS
jgi:hypothetical protein